MSGPLLWMPTPRQLRAGAVWITAKHWLMGCQHRYGAASLMTPDGVMSMDQLTAATAFHGASRTSGKPHRVRVLAETFVKDVRWALRDIRERAHPQEVPEGTGPFVWQHHDLFQTGGGRIARRLGLPLVTFVDAPYVWEGAQWGTTRPGWGRWVEEIGEKRELHRANLVLCVSDEVGEVLVDLGVKAERILVTPCTADPATFMNLPNLRGEYGLEGKIVVGWIGSFRSFHHLDLLVDAVAAVRQRVENVVLLLVGDGAERARILRYAESLGVEVVAPGAVDHEDTPKFLMMMDIATLPAGAEQQFHYSPLKLKEYMAAGRAVVAPRLGEMARVLVHGEDALLTSPGDLRELADAIAELASSVELREHLGRKAIATVRREFSILTQLSEVEARLGLSSETK